MSSPALDALTSSAPTGVVMVPLALIRPHPRNPRRELGDLTELTNSIRSQGVRQNLLLVPDPDHADGYRTVIGHRRAAAAALADLVEVPAAIDPTLTPEQELELMLVENLQRTDLTPVEEADGYQGLLDLGVSVATISDRTGRGESTVRRRLKLAALPDPARDAVHLGAATLEDAATLDEFEDDPKAFERVAAALGTADFRMTVQRVRRERETRAQFAELLAILEAAGAVEVDTYSGGDETRVHVLNTSTWALRSGDQTTIKDASWSANRATALAVLEHAEASWVWWIGHDDLYVWRPQSEDEAERDAARQAERDAFEAERAAKAARDRAEAEARDEERRALAEVVEASQTLRTEFLRRAVASEPKGAKAAAVVAFVADELCRAAWDETYIVPGSGAMLSWLGVDPAAVWAEALAAKVDEDDALDQAVLAAMAAMKPVQLMLATVTAASEPIEPQEFRTPSTRRWYALLEQLGYQPSTAERDALKPAEG